MGEDGLSFKVDAMDRVESKREVWMRREGYGARERDRETARQRQRERATARAREAQRQRDRETER